MNERKMFYFKIGVELGNILIEISFDSDSSSEAKKKKQEIYDMFDKIFADGHGNVMAFLDVLLDSNVAECMEITINKAESTSISSVSIFPIEANVKLLNGYSNFWENGVIVEKVESPLLAKIKKNKSVIFDITPRDFEKVVAEIYYNLGFDVELTPVAKDGGKDIIVVGNENGQPFVHLIECKRHSTRNPVGVSIVREFDSIVRREKANRGIIVATAHFTKDAKKEKEKYYKGVIEFEEFHKLFERV